MAHKSFKKSISMALDFVFSILSQRQKRIPGEFSNIDRPSDSVLRLIFLFINQIEFDQSNYSPCRVFIGPAAVPKFS